VGVLHDARDKAANNVVPMQLRNPLHAMVGALTILEFGDIDAADTRRELTSLRHGVDVMCAITNDFLDVQALSAGRLKLSLVCTNLRELLEGCVRSVRNSCASCICVVCVCMCGCFCGFVCAGTAAPSCSLRVETDMRTRRCAKYSMRSSSVHLAVGTDMPALLHIDPTRVRQVVMNGLTNAAKYGGGTPIELVARLTDSGEILIEVLDSGRGLGGHTLEELSADFSGISRGVSSPPQTVHATGESAFNKVRSTGMGIPICVRLAELMGGSLGLTDREDGPGKMWWWRAWAARRRR
jgi:signal transduction histidine kinase